MVERSSRLCRYRPPTPTEKMLSDQQEARDSRACERCPNMTRSPGTEAPGGPLGVESGVLRPGAQLSHVISAGNHGASEAGRAVQHEAGRPCHHDEAHRCCPS